MLHHITFDKKGNKCYFILQFTVSITDYFGAEWQVLAFNDGGQDSTEKPYLFSDTGTQGKNWLRDVNYMQMILII